MYNTSLVVSFLNKIHRVHIQYVPRIHTLRQRQDGQPCSFLLTDFCRRRQTLLYNDIIPTFLLFFADSEESLGPAKLTNEVLQIMEKIPDTVTAMTGHKVRSALT